MMIEKLLKFFISIVNTELLKRVKFENLESSNIQNSDEKVPLGVSRERAVHRFDDPVKEPLENGLTEGAQGVDNLRHCLTFCYVIGTDLDPEFYNKW